MIIDMQLSQETLLVRRMAAAGDGNNIVEIKTASGDDVAWKLAQLGILAKINDVEIHPEICSNYSRHLVVSNISNLSE